MVKLGSRILDSQVHTIENFMALNFNIRKARREDLPQIIKLLRINGHVICINPNKYRILFLSYECLMMSRL